MICTLCGSALINKKDAYYYNCDICKAILKDDGTIWEVNETGYYEMFSGNSKIVSNGALLKTGDNLSLYFSVPKTDTGVLEGVYLLLVHLTDTNDATIDDVIAQFSVTYKIKKAT